MLNQVTLMGRLTRDVELRYTQSQTPVASFTVAVERDTKEKETDFIDCVAWKQTGEFVSKYFTKGSMIAVTGSLQSRKWQDRDGNNRTSWEVNVWHAYFAGAKSEKPVNVQVDKGYDGFREMPGTGNDNPFQGANGAYKQAGIFEGDGELPF